MFNPITSYFGVHADALPLREQRMKLIASNLANADTPGYQAQDLDFNAALEAARRAREGQPGGPLLRTHERHLGDAIDPRGSFLVARPSSQPSLDGNTVDPDAERAAYGRAALEYRASLSFLESKVRTLLTAITGQ
ncbi:flagellar basal body rod protein FlgB [Pseudoxanthomonas taiwanensis]|jgi:flagellar basal-body rod protein FlgB|uniref:Flagellar basal body rod protein FlgB n=1 Tax=Pseudoxanthomonas taiwanensis TaxID=176598 RepID=A0A921P1Y6_9GAMM|nr:flagellar basal body rod protein FlgB [Pseudoxanthomonas taiwanensis]KAF1689988.1 flagellar basal body rod protein FlgB [Pseudoxanthomonas taiwanensis]MBO2467315.1 flagellar basal body rod protein FlgB [Xanthomonadaceae bacterium]